MTITTDTKPTCYGCECLIDFERDFYCYECHPRSATPAHRLTPAQEIALRLASQRHAVNAGMPSGQGRDSKWRVRTLRQPTLTTLSRCGLIRKNRCTAGNGAPEYEITPAGRAWLEALEGARQ